MEINNIRTYNLDQAIISRGFPFLKSFSKDDFESNVNKLIEKWNNSVDPENEFRKDHDYNSCLKLCKLGEPHCNFLTGILVSFNITATQAFFLQAHRYHWWQVVSSMSKMHCLKKFDAKGNMPLVDSSTVENFQELSNNVESNSGLIYDCPMGLQTTEQVVTNYQQLRTIYRQRKSHRLQEWKDFCNYIKENCPLSEFITGEYQK